MANAPPPDPVRMGKWSWVGATSLCLGLIGVGLSWLPPYAIVINAIGVLCGLAGLFVPSAGTRFGLRLTLGGLALSLVGLALCLVLMPTGPFTVWPLRAQ